MHLRDVTVVEFDYVRVWRNLDISGLRTPIYLTSEMQVDFYRDVVCNRNSSHRYFAVDDNECIVALVGLTDIQWENSFAEISLIVNPDYRRDGVGKESVELILDHAFNHLGLNMVVGECYTNNSEAIKFWEGIVYYYCGSATWLRYRKFWNGKYHDSMYFSITADEYRKTNSSI